MRAAGNAPMKAKLTLEAVNDRVVRVLTAQGEHVGNLKWIAGAWKFKAVGYEPSGAVVPGGGPLTDRHDLRFSDLDVNAISERLLSP